MCIKRHCERGKSAYFLIFSYNTHLLRHTLCNCFHNKCLGHPMASHSLNKLAPPLLCPKYQHSLHSTCYISMLQYQIPPSKSHRSSNFKTVSESESRKRELVKKSLYLPEDVRKRPRGITRQSTCHEPAYTDLPPAGTYDYELHR